MRWPDELTGLCYGGDWNPEQWPEPVWHEDVALMRQAGVNLVTVGVFSWAQLEPEPGRFTFDWLDRALDLLAANRIRANLATPTASPPPWFSLAHPDALPVTADGVRLSHGSRDTYCVAAPGYRAAAARIAGALADRYAHHPAVAMWHVHNEYGTGCHCDHVAAGFRRWLARRYGDLGTLNAAWGTAFWSQRYGDWSEILPPRATQYLPNPHQALDFRRFLSDQLLAAFREQREILRRANPAIPITTNFAFGDWVPVDHRRWAAELDLVALDAYPAGAGIEAAQQAAFLADLARHWAGGADWLLMEQAPDDRLHHRSIAAIARGSRGAMCFQWRASAAGAEQFHPAMVPHAGPDSRAFARARELGTVLPRIAEAATGTVAAPVAIGWDAESWWALRQPHLPAGRPDYLATLARVHAALWRRQVTADFADLGADLAGYRLVLVPSHYLATDRVIESVRRYVAGGGQLVVWYFSGIADQHGQIRLGGYPGGFREVLGVRVTEFHPLPSWRESVTLAGAEPVRSHPDGTPSITRHRYGDGVAWYVSTDLADADLAGFLAERLADAGVAAGDLPAGVELVRRESAGTSWLFALNHTDRPVRIPATGTELIAARPVPGFLTLPPGGYAVIRS
ncbi:MAG TPA: beta-galactosidase [Natronosporangium sp.]